METRRWNLALSMTGSACFGAIGNAVSSVLPSGVDINEGQERATRSKVAVVNVTRSVALATRAELALSGKMRARGLLGRTSLRDGEGLVIRPCLGVHSFGMKFAIDVAYANDAGTVVCVLSPLVPGKAGPVVREARWVVELPEGVLARTGTVVGDRLQVFYYR
ncbi:MAG: DUF192 domain-containing protein [Firmicutes bacterium]|jgi:uncharacterized membrane protein (UPF0127 family)|nr:DUF192 domain-containing protein [Bacillota bacterium]MDH7495173.1 DUF192 domain-containing protein [Bacillota bacterium]